MVLIYIPFGKNPLDLRSEDKSGTVIFFAPQTICGYMGAALCVAFRCAPTLTGL